MSFLYLFIYVTQVKLDKALVEDLITSKLRILKQHIDKILARFNESSSKEILEKTRKGIYKKTEDDVVELWQLLLAYTKLQEILNNL